MNDSGIHLRNQTSDGSQPNQTSKQPQKGSISETKVWWIPNPNRHKPWDQKDPLQKQNLMDFSLKQNPSKTHLRNKHLMGQNKLQCPQLVNFRKWTKQTTYQTQVFFPGFDYISYKAIGGKAKSSLQGFSVDESHVAELANHNKNGNRNTIETGVDIRLASTPITNPHCKGQIILRPDKMILQKLSTHTPQVVQTTLNHATWWVTP
jgi:hypothetical protein